MVIDATGMKIHGEGERHVRNHGKSKRRKWKRFHVGVGVGVETRQITALTMTESNVHDSLETDNLIQNTSSEIETVTGDKAYDNKHAYDAIARVKALPRTPPRSGAALTKNNMG
ncbi:MAG: transposase [Oligoflexales bacterium]